MNSHFWNSTHAFNLSFHLVPSNSLLVFYRITFLKTQKFLNLVQTWKSKVSYSWRPTVGSALKSSLKRVKNAFYFILKDLFVLKISCLTFCFSCLWFVRYWAICVFGYQSMTSEVLKLTLVFYPSRFPKWLKKSLHKFKYLENEKSF